MSHHDLPSRPGGSVSSRTGVLSVSSSSDQPFTPNFRWNATPTHHITLQSNIQGSCQVLLCRCGLQHRSRRARRWARTTTPPSISRPADLSHLFAIRLRPGVKTSDLDTGTLSVSVDELIQDVRTRSLALYDIPDQRTSEEGAPDRLAARSAAMVVVSQRRGESSLWHSRWGRAIHSSVRWGQATGRCDTDNDGRTVQLGRRGRRVRLASAVFSSRTPVSPTNERVSESRSQMSAGIFAIWRSHEGVSGTASP